MSENERQSQTSAISNDKLQGSAATYRRCGRVVNNVSQSSEQRMQSVVGF